MFEDEPLTKYKKTFKWLKKKVKKERRAELDRILCEWRCFGSVFNVNKKYSDVPNVKLDAFVFQRKLGGKTIYVLSFRGTNPLSPVQFCYDMKENLDLDVKQEGYNTQFGQAVGATIAFVEFIILTNRNNHYQFAPNPNETLYYITGHSKGGGLAHTSYIYLLENNQRHNILTNFGPLSTLNIYTQIATETFCPTPLIAIERWTKKTKKWNCTVHNIEGDRVIKLLNFARKMKWRLSRRGKSPFDDYLNQHPTPPQTLKKKGRWSFLSLKHDLKTFDDYFS